MRVLVFFLCPLILGADSLVLKSGAQVSGTYAGGDSRSIRFLIGDQLKVYAIGDVVRMLFDNGGGVTTGQRASGASDRVVIDHPSNAPVPDNLDKQRRFCEIIQGYRDARRRYIDARRRYINKPNQIKRAESRPPDSYDWEQRVVNVLAESGRFDNWTGTVRFHVDGRRVAVGSFFPDCQGFPQAIEFATANRYVLGSKDSNTMIALNSPIAQALSHTNGNQAVVASGHLFYLAHGSLGNLSRGQKAELRQRYKGAQNYPASSAHYLAAFDSIALKHSPRDGFDFAFVPCAQQGCVPLQPFG